MSDETSVQCSGCGYTGTSSEFGHRKDGRVNVRCPRCRHDQAMHAGVASTKRIHGRLPRDMQALRVVERFSGFAYDDWLTPEALVWQYERGYTLHELWSHRMRTLARRAPRVAMALAAQAVRSARGGGCHESAA